MPQSWIPSVIWGEVDEDRPLTDQTPPAPTQIQPDHG